MSHACAMISLSKGRALLLHISDYSSGSPQRYRPQIWSQIAAVLALVWLVVAAMRCSAPGGRDRMRQSAGSLDGMRPPALGRAAVLGLLDEDASLRLVSVGGCFMALWLAGDDADGCDHRIMITSALLHYPRLLDAHLVRGEEVVDPRQARGITGTGHL